MFFLAENTAYGITHCMGYATRNPLATWASHEKQTKDEVELVIDFVDIIKSKNFENSYVPQIQKMHIAMSKEQLIETLQKGT